MAWPGDRWTPSGGYCTDIKIGESVVSFIAAGNGDYARDQRPPVGYERAELEEIASRLVRETEDSGDRSRYGKLPGGHFRAECSGGYHRSETEKDYFGNPGLVWQRREPFRCDIEVVLAAREEVA